MLCAFRCHVTPYGQRGARDCTSLACRKEERRAQLAKAAEDMKNTGKAEAAFEDSGYAVGEGTLADLCIWSLCI